MNCIQTSLSSTTTLTTFILALHFILETSFISSQDLIPCPLVWVPVLSGETPPTARIPTAKYGLNNYVGRVYFGESLETKFWVAGTVVDGVFHSAYEGFGWFNSSFDTLTNPHNCEVDWVSNVDITDPLVIQIGSPGPGSGIVGRGSVGDVLVTGSWDGTGLNLVGSNGDIIYTTSAQLLRSYSKGLGLDVSHFEFESNPFGGGDIDFLGLDEVHNMADAVVRQTVVQSKEVFESTEITNTKSWGHVFTAKFTISLSVKYELGDGEKDTCPVPIPPIEGKWELKYPAEARSRFYSEYTRDISAVRELIVPPFSSVQACSTVQVFEGLDLSYKAQGRYHAPGLSSAQVASILAKDGITGAPGPDGQSILVEVTGNYAGTVVSATKFLTSQYGAEEGGCGELSNKVAEVKRIKRNREWARRSGKSQDMDTAADISRLADLREEIQRMVPSLCPNF